MSEIAHGVIVAAGLYAASLAWAALTLRPMARLMGWSGRRAGG